ncbi:MAG: 6-phosphofructokinase, partial [Thermoleophilia bacterium]|nr:6-phosphofructokinase [Thermoleophilia bacterium]
MRLGVLTGGGDVPGLNPCIKAFVNRVTAAGHEVVGIRRGWAGLLQYDANDPASAAQVLKLDPAFVRTIDRTGGTVLHTSRTNPGRVSSDQA